MKEKKGHERQVSTRILIGLLIGSVVGMGFNAWGENSVREFLLFNFIDPIGTAFLRGLFMIVVPLVFSSLAVGVANLGSIGHVGRLGWRVGIYYFCTTLIAVLIGQILVSIVKPGVGISSAYVEGARAGLASQVAGLMEKSQHVNESLWPGLISAIIPKNIFAALANGDMLAIIFVAILFGITLLLIDPTKSKPTIHVFEAISDACIKVVGWIMEIAPFAVAALMVSAVSKLGIEVMSNVIKYVGVVILGYLIHGLVIYPMILKFFLKISPIEFCRRAFPVIATSFSTSSSNATIPTTIRTLESRFGVPESLATFSIPLGATVNMDGTALFEAVAALFVAQVFGVEVGLLGQVTLVTLVIFTSIGVAGVPGGSIPLLMSAMATMGIPAEGIALILGVDRLLDMGRTTLNVVGDMTATLYLARVEKVPLEANMARLS